MKIRDGKLPTGKGMFIWELERLRIQHGSIEKLVEDLVLEGYQWAAVKIQEGIYPFTANNQQVLLQEFVDACKKLGLEFHAWGTIYLRNLWTGASLVNREVAITLQMIGKWKPLSFMIDDERERPWDRSSHADSYMRQIKSGMAVTGDAIPDIPLGLSSHRFPEYHQGIPWATYARYIDFWAPQVYWQADTRLNGASDQLRKSIVQHEAYRKLPFVPAGTIYPEGNAYAGWWTSPYQLDDFNETCKELERVVGVNYWEYWYPRQFNKVDIINSLSRFEWKKDDAPPEDDPQEKPCADIRNEIVDIKRRIAKLESAQ